jgi:UDP-N-acetylglucosamine acyltransferase
MIHPTAIIHPNSKIGENTKIGPYCVIGKDVKVGANCNLKSHVVLDGEVNIGDKTNIFSFVSIGSEPQDLKFKGEKTQIIIGDNCKIREYCTINPGTEGGGGVTKVGDNCLLMVGTHIAHDCLISDNVIFANHSTLAGHVNIEKNVVVGALSAIHQFTRIGEGAMIGGMSGITGDVPPFCTAMGNRAKLNGLNIVGLKRNEISKIEISELRKVYNFIFISNKLTFKDRVKEIEENKNGFYTINRLLDFLSEESNRSFCLP